MPGDVAVVIHPRPLMLSLAAPVAAARAHGVGPAGRRYFAGFFGARRDPRAGARGAGEAGVGVPGLARGADAAPRGTSTRTWWWARTTTTLPPPFSPATFRALRALGLALRGSRGPPGGPGAPHARGGGAAAARGRAARSSRPRRATRWCWAARCSRCWTPSRGRRRAPSSRARPTRQPAEGDRGGVRAARRRASSAAGTTTWPRSRRAERRAASSTCSSAAPRARRTACPRPASSSARASGVGHGGPIGAVADHGVVGVAGEDDPRARAGSRSPSSPSG